MTPPALALSIGCPAGIGPEVAVSAAAALADRVRPVLVGDPAVVRAAARLRGVPRERVIEVLDRRGIERLGERDIGVWAPSTPLDAPVEPGAPHRGAGAAQLHWIDEATDLVTGRLCQALVTGPVSKAAIAESDAPGARRFRGHTEHLAERLGAGEVVMAFRGEKLTVALVTTHLPLREVPAAITSERVERAILELVGLLAGLGHRKPRVVVAGLNPHAGERGLLGDEEKTVIAPAIGRARARLDQAGREHRLTGPLGAETAFRTAAAGEHDGVVVMYHDQATIPLKLVGFGEAVNVTLGLPIVRTSVDHGTAYDLAGSGTASDRGMREALLLARELVLAKR